MIWKREAMCLPYLFKSMADTEIAFVFDKDLGLVERRVPRNPDPSAGASVTVRGVLSASVLQGSGSGGGGDSSFPLDPVPTIGSFLVTDADGNPTVSSVFSITATEYYGLHLTTEGSDVNFGLTLTSVDGTNYGIKINSADGNNYGIDINSTTGQNYGIDIISTTGVNYGIDINSTTGVNYGLNITKTGAGVNSGITISASGGATSSGLTITGGGGGVTVDGVNIVPLAINAHYPLVQTAHTTVTRTLALADTQDIVPLSAASNAIEVTIPHTLFASGGPGRAFECRLRAMSVAGGAITFVGSGGIVITYHGKNPGTTPIVAGDFIRVLVTSATSADVWVDAVAV